MIDDETLDIIIDTFNDCILSPVMYIYDDPDEVLIVAFYDKKIESDYIFGAEKRISAASGVKVKINDIRSYDVQERMDIVQNADISYCENQKAGEDFFNSMLEDYFAELGKRTEIMMRYDDTETYYLQ
ncbi:MAG: hypothetical protein LUD03_06110 [Firmicutes bacterium]|nr:hypothetical protein [Bacillota bacterium]